MDQDDRGRSQFESAADDLADMNRGLVDRALAHHLVADQHVAGVEVKDPEPLDRVMDHVGAQVIQQCLPVRQDRPGGDAVPQQPDRGGMRDLQRGDRRFAHAGHPGQCVRISGQHPANATEFA